MKFQSIPIEDIKIENRIRKSPGRIHTLAHSIKKLGMLHPVIIDSDFKLISGYRRIEAAKYLSWKEVPCAIVSHLTEALPLLEAEVEENTEREPFTPREMAAAAERLEPLLIAEAKKRMARKKVDSESNEKPESIIHEGKLTPVETFHTLIKVREQLGQSVGTSGRNLQKIRQVIEAEKRNPEKYGPIADRMERTRKVDPAVRALDKAKQPALLRLPKQLRNSDEDWRKTIRDWKNQLVSLGNIAVSAASWPLADEQDFIGEIENIVVELNNLTQVLKEDVNAKQRKAGSKQRSRGPRRIK